MRSKTGNVGRSNRARHARCSLLVELLESRQYFSKAFGTPDSTFGTGGFASIRVTGDSISPNFSQVVTDFEGNIYAAGSGGIARFTSAGAVDDSFGDSGLAALPSGDSLVGEAVDPQGNLDVLLRSSAGTVLARYTPAGVLDLSYGQGGIAQVTSDTNFTPNALAVQPDGKPVIAGTESTAGGGAEMTVFRLTATASADTTFGDNGVLSAYLGTYTALTPTIYDDVAGLKILSNGNLLVAGASLSFSAQGTASAPYFAVARITPSGQLDASYGTDGISQTLFAGFRPGSSGGNPGRATLHTSFDALPDGRVVLAGSIYSLQTTADNYAAAITAAGEFTYNLVVPTDGIEGGPILGVAALGDGRSVLIGQPIDVVNFESGAGPFAGDLTMTPVNNNGTLGQTATTFNVATNSSTLATVASMPSTLESYAPTGASITVASSGRIVVGGVAAKGDAYDLEQVDQGSASAPPTDQFANATANSIAVPTPLASGSNVFVGFGIDLAYYDSATQTLMFVQRLNNGLWDTPITVDGTKGAGEYLSLATDDNDEPSIAFYDSKSHSLKFAASTNDGKRFRITTLDSGDTVGLYPSLTFNAATPEIAYYDKTDGTLKFATRNSKNKWLISTIDSSGNVGREATLALDNSFPSRTTVTYLDSTHGEVKWAQLSSSGKWEIKVAAKVHKGIGSLSMTYTSLGEPSILYYDVARKELVEADYLNGAFTTTVIGSDQGQFVAATPGPAEDDAVATTIFAYYAANDSVLFYPDGDSPGESSTVVNNGGRYLSLAIELNGLGGNGPLVQVAYLDSTSGDLEVEGFAVPNP